MGGRGDPPEGSDSLMDYVQAGAIAIHTLAMILVVG